MMCWRIQPSRSLKGTLRPPSSKSQSLRALLFASLAKGPCELQGILQSPDAAAMTQACEKLGARFHWTGKDRCSIEPMMNLASDQRALLFDSGNSGIVWRFITAINSLRPGLTLMTGDRSILERRPIDPLLGALKELGAHTWRPQGSKGPCILKGPLKFEIKSLIQAGFDSQPVSALLIAAAAHGCALDVHVQGPKEVPWAKLTVSWLKRLGIAINSNEEGTFYRINSPGRWPGFNYTVSADYSSAAFLIAAAVVTRSQVNLEGLDPDELQPDKELLTILDKAGVAFTFDRGLLRIDGRAGIIGFEANLSGPIDLLPILATLACYAKGPSSLYEISGARLKESDRIVSITTELTKMGARFDIGRDWLKIYPAKLSGCENLQGHNDHRIAMALAIAALGASTASLIHGVGCVAKTYPKFAADLRSIGAIVEEGK